MAFKMAEGDLKLLLQKILKEKEMMMVTIMRELMDGQKNEKNKMEQNDWMLANQSKEVCSISTCTV